MNSLKSSPALSGRIFSSFILIYFFFFIVDAIGQAPQTLWKKTFGGTNIDVGSHVIQSSDGGYAITGYTRSYGTMSGRNILLLKTDSSGNQLSINAYGGNDDEEGFGIRQTFDRGYIIVGYTKSFGAGAKDVIIQKTDSLGNSEWMRTFGGSNDDEGYSIQQTSDRGFIIAGATSSSGAGSRDVYLVRTDANGNLRWAKTLGGMSSDGAWCVQLTSDGGFIITGWTFSYGPGFVGNVWLVKTDSLGNQIWHKYFGGSDADRGLAVEQTTDGGYIITGYTASYGAGLDDLYLIKTDSAGNEQWSKTFGGSGRDYGNFVQQAHDGGYIITGYTLSFGAGSEDVWLIKTDPNGNKTWDITYGGAQSDVGNCVKQTSDGEYIIAGYTLSYGAGVHDVWLIKTAPEQNTITISFQIQPDWNLLSVPLNLANMNIASIFPEAVSNAYYYDNGYITATTAQLGKGFWLKFNSAQTKNLTGIPQSSININLNAGWNLIGPLHVNVPTSNITTNPPGIISSLFFGYSNGYQAVTTLEKGKGYWIKVSSNGTMIIPTAAGKRK